LVLHDTLFYATREVDILYETGQYIHNYALSYALFNDTIIKVPYSCASHGPDYPADLEKLNERKIYVTPARPVSYSYILTTWKITQETWRQKPERFGGKNYPRNIGRAKELAPGSTFEFFLLSQKPTTLPHWIRLGKWMSKAEVQLLWEEEVAEKEGVFTATHPLNPLDVPGRLIGGYDIINMPPVSLVLGARIEGSYYEIKGVCLPAGMRYTFPKGENRFF
jgi:CRISPR-associated protein Csc1